MLTSPETIILEKDSSIFEKKFFLISGNEETLIKKIEYKLLSKLREKKYENIEKIESGSLDSGVGLEDSEDLFGHFKTLVFYSPKNIDLDYLNSADLSKTAIIISHPGLKKSSKLLKELEKNPSWVVLNCYKLSRENKRIYFENFIKDNNLVINKECFWFFIDNTSDYFQLFENEMLKLQIVYNENISLNDMKLILSKYNSLEIEKLFFLTTKSSKEIVLKTDQLIQSVSDGILMIQKIKFFVDILSKSKNIAELEKLFPRYLFKEKPLIFLIFKKMNTKKILSIVGLIKKAELALRKNSSLYLPISQRFLLNLAKNIR